MEINKLEQRPDIGKIRTSRAILPNDFELYKKEVINRQIINVSLPNVQEAIRVRAFTRQEVNNKLYKIKNKEQQDYMDFCNKYPHFKGIFYAQLEKRTSLSTSDLQDLDYIQNISQSDIRLIYQTNSNNKLIEFVNRISEFNQNNPNKINIPLLDLDVNTTDELIVLRQKLEHLIAKGYKKIAVIFRGRITYSRAWNTILPRLVETNTEIYVLEVPTKKDGIFTPLIYAIMIGGNKICHRRNKTGRSGEIPFLERTWEMRPYQSASNGLADYNGLNRKQFLINDRRKGTIYPFSKWDKIVQANEFCRTDLNVVDLTQVIYLKKAFSHFF